MAFAKKPVTLTKDKTVIDFVGNNKTNSKIEIHTTITVIVVKTTPAELTGFISALPSTDNLTYADHYKIVMSYQRSYAGFTDEEKKQLSAETLKKLQDSVARMEELKKRHEDGIQAWIDLVNTFAGKVTAENYAQYYDAVQKAQVKYLELSDAQRAEFAAVNSAENAAVMTAYEAAYRTVNEQSILDGSSIGKPTEYYDDFMMGANHYNLDLGHEDTYYPAVFREIWTNRPTTLYPAGYAVEKGLPYTLPGILKFDIKDDSIFEIKEVEDVYKDGGLGGGSTLPAMKYYLVPKKAGTTTFTVTFTDKAGNFYGQIPEIPVHVNSPEETAIQDLNKNLTNFTSLSNTSKYDNWTYDYGTEGAPFTFKVSGTNAKVSVYNYLQYNKDGTPVKTDYTPDAKGNVTILLKDGYNGIEVTADYQGQTVTQVYSLKGKVTRYVQENISRPGEPLRTGDTAGIWIIGRPTNIHKILRIYNPATTTVFYTDMPLQSVVNTDNQHDINRIDENGVKKQVSYQPRVAAYLTESGTITLTKGSSDNRGYGSNPGSEGDQGNTGGIAASTRYGFGMLADITLQVENNPNFKLEPKYETVAENGGQVKAGDKLTISIPTLPIEQLAQDYKLQYCLLNYSTNIPGAEYIFSKWSKGGDSWEGEGTTPVGPEVALKSITFTVPKTTPAGTYRIYGGYLDVTHRSGGYEWLDKYAKFYRMEISDLTITVLKGDIETVEDLIDAIGANVTLDSEAAITAAKSAYDALSDEDKALVDADKVDALTAAIIRLNQLKHADLMANLDTIYKTTGDFMATLGTPTVNSTGGEWMVIGLARSGRTVPAGYYDNVVEYVKAKADANERLHPAKVTRRRGYSCYAKATQAGRAPRWIESKTMQKHGAFGLKYKKKALGNAGGLLLHSICLRLKSVAQLAPLRLVCKNTPCLHAIRSLLEMGIHVLIVLIEIHFILVGIAEALDGEAVELDDIPVLQHARHQSDAAADIAHIHPCAGPAQTGQHQQGDQDAGHLFLRMQAAHRFLLHHALVHHDLGEALLHGEKTDGVEQHGGRHEEGKQGDDGIIDEYHKVIIVQRGVPP